MKFIDSHAHIYLEQFKQDIDEVLYEAGDKDIDKIYMPNIDGSTIEPMLELADRFTGFCIPMMGLHPCSVNKNFEEELAVVASWLGKRQFAAVGEIGTDLYWDKSLFDIQVEAFCYQMDLAREYQLPIVIHCRESMDETIDLVEKHKNEALTGVFHCFTGNLDQAQRIIDLGFYLGIGGVVTFKNGGLEKVIPHVDLNNILLETDSPYLAPAPFRGKRNDPGKISIIAGRIASLKQCTIEEVGQVTTKNVNRVLKNVEEK